MTKSKSQPKVENKHFSELTFEEFYERSKEDLLKAIGDGTFKSALHQIVSQAYSNGYDNSQKKKTA